MAPEQSQPSSGAPMAAGEVEGGWTVFNANMARRLNVVDGQVDMDVDLAPIAEESSGARGSQDGADNQ